MCYFDAQITETLQYKAEGLTYLPLWENVTNNSHGINLWNKLQSSSFPLLHLWKILHKFQATLHGQIGLLSPFPEHLPYTGPQGLSWWRVLGLFTPWFLHGSPKLLGHKWMELLLIRIIIEESEEASLVPGHGSIPAFSRNSEPRSIIWQDTPGISGCFWAKTNWHVGTYVASYHWIEY